MVIHKGSKKKFELYLESGEKASLLDVCCWIVNLLKDESFFPKDSAHIELKNDKGGRSIVLQKSYKKDNEWNNEQKIQLFIGMYGNDLETLKTAISNFEVAEEETSSVSNDTESVDKADGVF